MIQESLDIEFVINLLNFEKQKYDNFGSDHSKCSWCLIEKRGLTND